MSTTPATFIRVHALEKTYPGETPVPALRGIDLEVDEGTFLGVMGQSGSGKSTLLAVLGAICHPSAGDVLIDGIDVYGLSSERRADFRRAYLGFVFQSFNLVPYLTALENVMIPLAVARIPAAEKRAGALALLARVGLAARASHLPSQLSGGEQERVAVARALVNDPLLLLADEPTGSLDTATGHEIMGLLTELNAEGLTIVMVSHNPENLDYFHRAVVLRDGLVECGQVFDPVPSVTA